MTTIVKWFRFVRGFNLLMVAIAMFLFQCFIVVPIITGCGLRPSLNWPHFAMLILAVVLIMAAGNVVNDCFDFEQDKTYKKWVAIGDIISLEGAYNLQFVLAGLGVAIGFYLGTHIGHFHYGYYFVFAAVFLWLYSMLLKRYFLVGNITVALLSAFVLVLVVLFEPQVLAKHENELDGMLLASIVTYMKGYAFFCFLITLTREIVKDVEDREADAAYGYHTLPVVLPPWVTRAVVASLMLVSMLLIGMLQKNYWANGDKKHFWYCMFTIQAQQLLNLIALLGISRSFEYGNLSVFIKLLMVFGILSIPFFYWFSVGVL